jgi:uncharacterized protein YbjT (DUF2867 family)
MILVTGSTGLIGRHVVARLIAEGHVVRCLLPESRQEKLPWNADDGNAPQIMNGTLLDEESLFSAVSGVHTIIHLENAQWWGRSRDLERVEVVGSRNLIAVARSARVGRIITISHLGAAPASAFTLLRIKGIVEGMLRDSGLAYTIIRSGLVFGPEDAFINHIAMMLAFNPLFFLMSGRGEVVLHPIHIDDLVESIIRSLKLIGTVDQTMEIGGPEYLTYEDLLRTVMRVTSRRRLIVSIPPYIMRRVAGFYSLLFFRSLMTPQWLDILAANRVARLGNTYNYFGFHPRRFEDTLLTYMPGKRYLLRALRYALRRRPRGV